MWSGRPSPRRHNDGQRIRRQNRQIRQDDAADFWNESASWEPKSHDVDPDAPTRPSGIERLAQTRPVEAARKQWSLLNLDPFVSRIVLIVVGFALVVPVAWTTRRTSDEANALSASTQLSGTQQLNNVTPSTPIDQPSVPPNVPQVQANSAESVASTSSVTVSISSAPMVPDTTSAPTYAPPATALATREVATTVATTAPVCGSTYVVRPGDSWTLIADRASIGTSQLLAVNGSTRGDMLYAGDELCLPPGVRVVIPTTTVAAAPSTTAAPTTTTTEVIPPAPSNSQAEAIIRSVWPDDLEERALKIAWRESNYRADADNGGCCVGLFQMYWTVHRSWLGSIGVTSRTQLFDAETNARAALALYERALARRGDGWQPWCYGSYLQTDACAGL